MIKWQLQQLRIPNTHLHILILVLYYKLPLKNVFSSFRSKILYIPLQFYGIKLSGFHFLRNYYKEKCCAIFFTFWRRNLNWKNLFFVCLLCYFPRKATWCILVWPALFSCYLRFEICPFVLLMKTTSFWSVFFWSW